jgi:hypothetical protein
MHIVSIFSNNENNQVQIGSIDPYGNGYFNFQNGQIRLKKN